MWSAKKTVGQLLKSMLIASVFALAIACFYGSIFETWETIIVDLGIPWIMLSVFVMLFFYASELDQKKV